MSKRSDLFYTFLHLPVDVFAIILAFMTSYWLRGDGVEIYRLPYNDYLQLVYQTIPIWIGIFALQGLYSKRYLFGSLQNMSHLAISVLAGWASFIVFLMFLKNEQTLVFPRLLLIYLLVFGFVYVFVSRFALRFIQFLLRSIGIGRSRVMLVGAGRLADSLENELMCKDDVSIEFIKRLHTASPEALKKDFTRNHIDEVYIADHSLSDNQVLEFLFSAYESGVACHLVPNVFEVQSGNVLFSTLAGFPLMTFRQTPLDGWGRIVKRLIDLLLSFIGIVLLSPVFLIIAMLIKITDPGPVLFGHTRISRGGKKVKVYKFRTMLQKYCSGSGSNHKSPVDIFKEMGRSDLIGEFERNQKVKDDPRVSPLGRFLRKTSLDELPQLFNVIHGELSLVGPRPIVEDELKRYGKWASYLLSIKPGVTGLWQVSGRNNVSYEQRVQIDAQYVQNWSLWQDFVIIIKTFLTVFVGRDGY
jgi:exopolysaccharide biosynthesis polyprenyl glycosylphosphotransferase